MAAVSDARREASKGPTRRTVLAGLAALAGMPGTAVAAAPTVADGLRARAARRGIAFGCAVQKSILDKDRDFRAAVLREAGLLVCESEMKWGRLQPTRAAPDYRTADAMVAFAKANDLGFRGHTAVWYRSVPDWAEAVVAGPGGEALILAHVGDVVGRYKGRIADWDVVNEAIEVSDGNPGFLRNWAPLNRGGYDFIADCFKAAHEADPGARLYYNDYDVEYATYDNEMRRQGTLKLLSELKRRGAPVHGLGIQGHLTHGNRFSDMIFRRFLADVAAMGLSIRLTEFDISDRRLEGSLAERDRQIAAETTRFLSVALDEPAVTGVLTWGLSNRYSWLNETRPRADRGIQRCLPLDEDNARTPLWDAMAACFDNAPDRR